MSTEYMSATTVSDHDLTLAIPGDVESVRARLVKALQSLGYKILSEQPIQAKRGAQGSARWDCSLNVLDYPTTLIISLKQTNDVAAVATFNYEVKSYMSMTKGDRQTLAREAEAMAALATERLASSACSSCGTQVTDESHFCRRCGAPLVTELAELEVLRLTRGSRSSYHNIFVGVVILLLALLTVLLILILSGGRIVGPLLWVGMPLLVWGLLAILQGTWQLHRTLNRTPSSTVKAQPVLPSSITTALPSTTTAPSTTAPSTTSALSPPSNASVTEGTTELLFSNRDRRVAEPVRRRKTDTSELDEERLM